MLRTISAMAMIAAMENEIVSGILADGHDHVLAALSPMRPVTTVTKDGWAAVQLRW